MEVGTGKEGDVWGRDGKGGDVGEGRVGTGGGDVGGGRGRVGTGREGM